MRRTLRAFCSSTTGDIVSGDTARGVRSALSSRVVLRDIVGTPTSGSGSLHRVLAGDVLGLMDICAARTAMLHCTGKMTFGSGMTHSVCTVGVENTTFSAPLLHGDMVEVVGTPVYCGSSSAAIHVSVRRAPYNTMRTWQVASAYFTMVAIDKALKAAKIVPAVSVPPELQKMHQEYAWIRDGQQAVRKRVASYREQELSPQDLDDDVNRGKPQHVAIASTTSRANRLFMSRHLNLNNTIFGGELLRWMELHATHCARMFTRNAHVFSLGMHSVRFDSPVLATDWVSLDANVIYVRNTTLEVDVCLNVERSEGTTLTNRASFVVVNTDEIGQKRLIDTGLDLQVASKVDLTDYAIAKMRYEESSRRLRHE